LNSSLAGIFFLDSIRTAKVFAARRHAPAWSGVERWTRHLAAQPNNVLHSVVLNTIVLHHVRDIQRRNAACIVAAFRQAWKKAGLSEVQDADRNQKDCLDDIEGSTHHQPDQPEGKQQKPHERIKQKGNQCRRPAENQKNKEEQKFDHASRHRLPYPTPGSFKY